PGRLRLPSACRRTTGPGGLALLNSYVGYVGRAPAPGALIRRFDSAGEAPSDWLMVTLSLGGLRELAALRQPNRLTAANGQRRRVAGEPQAESRNVTDEPPA